MGSMQLADSENVIKSFKDIKLTDNSNVASSVKEIWITTDSNTKYKVWEANLRQAQISTVRKNLLHSAGAEGEAITINFILRVVLTNEAGVTTFIGLPACGINTYKTMGIGRIGSTYTFTGTVPESSITDIYGSSPVLISGIEILPQVNATSMSTLGVAAQVAASGNTDITGNLSLGGHSYQRFTFPRQVEYLTSGEMSFTIIFSDPF